MDDLVRRVVTEIMLRAALERESISLKLAETLAILVIAECFKWRPIESAKKDGTHILLGRFVPGQDMRTTYGYWLVLERGEYLGDCGGDCRCPEYDEPPEPSWYSEDGGFTKEHPPTHWLPLPEPPKDEK